jgi:hypothetical protein
MKMKARNTTYNTDVSFSLWCYKLS